MNSLTSLPSLAALLPAGLASTIGCPLEQDSNASPLDLNDNEDNDFGRFLSFWQLPTPVELTPPPFEPVHSDSQRLAPGSSNSGLQISSLGPPLAPAHLASSAAVTASPTSPTSTWQSFINHSTAQSHGSVSISAETISLPPGLHDNSSLVRHELLNKPWAPKNPMSTRSDVSQLSQASPVEPRSESAPPASSRSAEFYAHTASNSDIQVDGLLIQASTSVDTSDGMNAPGNDSRLAYEQLSREWTPAGLDHAELKIAGLSQEPLEISITLHGEQTQLEFRTDDRHGRELLAHSAGELETRLRQEGIHLTDISVGCANSDTGSRERHSRPASKKLPWHNVELTQIGWAAGVGVSSRSGMLDCFV